MESNDDGSPAALYVNAGSDMGLKEGDLLRISRPGRAIKDPQTKLVIGRTKDTPVGLCRITSVTPGLSFAEPSEGQSFKTGDVVRLAGAAAVNVVAR